MEVIPAGGKKPLDGCQSRPYLLNYEKESLGITVQVGVSPACDPDAALRGEREALGW